jgi:hypothetical protein
MCLFSDLYAEAHLANKEEPDSDGREGLQRGLIRNRRHAIVAVLVSFTVLASAFHSAIRRAPQNRWLFEPMSHSYLFGTPASIVLSIIYWCFVVWILFWFYKAASDRNERFLVVGFAIGYVLSVISGFLPLSIQTNFQFASIPAFLVSFASSVTVLTKLSSGNKIAP